MRKIIILLLLLQPAMLYAEEEKIAKKEILLGKVMENGIRVRSESNTSSRILGNVYKGEK